MTAVELVLLLALVAVATWIVVARMRRRRGPPRVARGEREPPLPVILVHGLMGFDQIGLPGAKIDYFRGVARHLASLGCHAHAVRVPGTGAVPDRAKALADAIEALPHPRVDIIAHSLGGLDARYALAHLGLASRVRALVTIGTPHRGTPLADLATDGPLSIARRALAAIGITMAALDWLSPSAMDKFNRDVPDAPGVRYACVVAGIRDDATPIALPLALAHAYLRRVAGANDGMVPMASQYWGETLSEVEADHLAQIGWQVPRGHFDAQGLYAFVVAKLGDASTAAARRGPSATISA